jgi:hypothetical protein
LQFPAFATNSIGARKSISPMAWPNWRSSKSLPQAMSSASGLDDRRLAFAFANRRLAFTRAVAGGNAQGGEKQHDAYQAFPHREDPLNSKR